MKYDLNEIRVLAGLPILNERYNEDDDDGDGLSRSERELANKADGDLKKRGIKVKVDADKDTEGKGGKDAKDDEDDKPASKPSEKKEEKSDAPKGEGLTKEKKAAKARAWLTAHPNATRGEFTKAAAEYGVGAAYANTFFYAHKKRTKAAAEQANEVFIIVHPTGNAYLAESKHGNEFAWTNEDAPLVYENRADAESLVKFFAEFKNQNLEIETIYLGEAGVGAADWRDAIVEKHVGVEFLKNEDKLSFVAVVNERKVGYWNDRFDNGIV